MTAWIPTIQIPHGQFFTLLPHIHAYSNNTLFGIASHYLAHTGSQEKYAHHISALVTRTEDGKNNLSKSYSKALITTSGNKEKQIN